MPVLISHPGAMELTLSHRDEEIHEERFLDLVPLPSFYTVEQAKPFDLSYTGLSEEVLQEILGIFCDVFEFAMKTNWWSYEKRIEFYHSFPFEELPTRKSIKAFHQTLFRCPAFDGFEWPFLRSKNRYQSKSSNSKE